MPWFLDEGMNTISIEARDDAGNVNTETLTVTLEWDTPVPQTPSGQDEGDNEGELGTSYGVAFLVAGLTVLIFGLFIVHELERRDPK